MVSRWHLLHLPVTLQDKQGHWGWVDGMTIRWPEGVVEGFGIHTAIHRFYIPARLDSLTITHMAIQLRLQRDAEKRSRSWWKAFHAQPSIINRFVWKESGELVGRIKDVLIDETSLAVHEIVVSRGLLEDLWHGALLVPTRELREDPDGKIKISSNRAI